MTLLPKQSFLPPHHQTRATRSARVIHDWAGWTVDIEKYICHFLSDLELGHSSSLHCRGVFKPIKWVFGAYAVGYKVQDLIMPARLQNLKFDRYSTVFHSNRIWIYGISVLKDKEPLFTF